ncbi:hypothetical protein K439DRAFT_1624572 [Ramaria rubella]|nr:hypothetical protein K439DRAFT_1624572 [Ramaria rubella]
MALPSSVDPATLYRPALYGEWTEIPPEKPRTLTPANLKKVACFPSCLSLSHRLIDSVTGINICQTYGYVNSNSDRKLFKVILVLLVLLDLLGSIVITLVLDHNVLLLPRNPWRCHFDDRNDPDPLGSAQSYTAWTIYILDCRWWPLCVLILVDVFGEIGLGIYIVEKTIQVKSLSSVSGSSFHVGVWVISLGT